MTYPNSHEICGVYEVTYPNSHEICGVYEMTYPNSHEICGVYEMTYPNSHEIFVEDVSVCTTAQGTWTPSSPVKVTTLPSAGSSKAN